MVRLSEFPDHFGTDVTGQYRVIAIQDGWNDARAMPSFRLVLADYTGQASIIVPPPLINEARDLRRGSIVNASISPRNLNQRLGGTLKTIDVVAPDGVTNIAAMMPAALCPDRARPSLSDLVALLDRVKNLELRKFINVVLDRHHAEFLRAMGAWTYHHAYPGGLIVHSTQVALECEHLATTVNPFDSDKIDIAIVGGLLHDFGKALQLQPGSRRAVVSSTPHEILTLQLVREDMLTLAERWPDGANRLNDILLWLAKHPDQRPKGHQAELVHMADIVSVWCDREFAVAPDSNHRLSA